MSEEIKENKELKKKKAKKRGLIIGLVALLTVTAGAVFVGLNFKSLETWFKRRTLSTEEYYRYVELQAFREAGKPTMERYETLKKSLAVTENKQSTSTFQIELGEELQELFRRFGINDFMDTDTIGVALTAGHTNKAMTQTFLAKLLLNGESLVSGDALLDYTEDLLFLGIPELSDKYLFSTLEDAFGYDAESTKELLELLPELSEQLPDRKIAEKFLERYVELLLSEIDDIRENSDTLEIADVKQECTKYSYSLNVDQIRDAAVLILEELAEDEEFEAYFIGVFSELEKVEAFFLDGEEAYDSFIVALEEKIAEIESLDDGDEYEKIKVNVWVDGDGKVIARDYKMKGEFEFFCGITKETEEFGFSMHLVTDDPIFDIVGTGKRKNDEVTGDFSLELNDYLMAKGKFTADSDSDKPEENHYCKVILTPDGKLPDLIDDWNDEGYFKLKEPKLILTAETAGEAFKAEIEFKNDGEVFAGLTYSYVPEEVTEPVYPPEENRMNTESEEEMLHWLATLDATAFEEKLIAQNVPELWAEGLADIVRDKQYEEAEWLFANKDYETARVLFHALGDYYSADDFETTCRAMVLYEAEKYEEALELLEATEPTNYYAELCRLDCYFQKAEAMFAEEKYAEALEYYKIYIDGEPEHLPQNGKECYYRLGLEAYEAGNYEEAYELFSHIQGYRNADSYMSWSDYEGALTQVPFGRLYAPDYEAFMGVVTLPENYLEILLPTVKENYYQSYMCEYAYTQMCYYVGNENAWEEMQLDPDPGVHFSDAQAEEMSRGIYPTEASYQAFMRNKCEEYYYIPKLKEYLLANGSVAQLDEESIRRNVVKARTEMELIASLMNKSTSFYIGLFGFKTMDEFLADAEAKAREDQMFYHILYGIAKKEGLSLSEEEFTVYAEEYACTHKITLEEFLKVNDRAVLEQVFLIECAMDYLIDNASFTEEQR